MWQRIIMSALERGRAAYASDESLYESLFGDVWLLGDAEVEAIKKYFRDNPIQLVHGYPVQWMQTKNPTVYVIPNAEEQPQHAVGDAGGAAGAGQGSAGIGVAGSAPGVDGSLLTSSMWTHNLTLACVAMHTPNNALYLYEVVKAIMVTAKEFFQASPNSLDLLSYGGSDVAPDGQHQPDILYIRNLSVRCMREYSLVDRNSSLARYFKVDGVALPSDSPVGPTDALALATTFPPPAPPAA